MDSHIVIVTPGDMLRSVFEWLPGDNDWLLLVCIVTALSALPLALRLVPPNPIYGFRTRFTRSSREVWFDANAFAGRAMLVASIVSAFILLAVPTQLGGGWGAPVVVFMPMALATLAMWLYLRHLRETLERR
jgi:uncharacterized membrane protein